MILAAHKLTNETHFKEDIFEIPQQVLILWRLTRWNWEGLRYEVGINEFSGVTTPLWNGIPNPWATDSYKYTFYFFYSTSLLKYIRLYWRRTIEEQPEKM